jgi:hypothetical protein
MDNNAENFDQLRQLLKLKQHEVPPPGYFDRLPREIISELRAQRRGAQDANSIERLGSEAPWLMRFWRAVESKPVFGGAFGAAVCALVLGAIYLTEKPAERPGIPGTHEMANPFGAAHLNTASAGSSLGSPLLLAATNNSESTGPNLFDMAAPLQAVPVSTAP